MKKKILLWGLVPGVLLAACGGALPEGTDTSGPPGTVESAVCQGWDSGARRCSWKCTGSAPQWSSVGMGVVAEGQCQEFADHQCGRTAYVTCWSR